MRQEIIDLYDEFTHKGLDRRVFMERLVGLTGSVAAAGAALAALQPDMASAQVVPPDDRRLSARHVTIDLQAGPIRVYRARLAAGNTPRGGVVVIHENRGLNAHIEDVARRLALDGFLVFAPDLLSTAGGTPADPDRARDMIGQLNPNEVNGQVGAVLTQLRLDPGCNGKVGIVGFCWGGGVVGRVATVHRDLNAGVVYYGPPPPLDDVPSIRAPLMLHYAGQDARINAMVPAFEAALKAAGVRFQLFMYEGAQHAFNNDTSTERYDRAAAELAWGRTVGFFNEELA
jgi:carboxymethylenebutenolidase